MKVKFLFFFFFILSSSSLLAQPKERFFEETFLLDLEVVFKEDKLASKEEQAAYSVLRAKYADYWHTYASEYKIEICQIANSILGFKNRSASTLFLFLQANEVYYKSDFPNYSEWLSVNLYLSKNAKNSVFVQFNKNITRLIQEKRLSKGLSGSWVLSNLDFELEDKNENSPVFIFKDVNLFCVGAKDSIQVFNTSLRYFPLEDKCEGTGGRVFWSRVLFEKESVFANLSTYKVDLSLFKLSADSVGFYNSAYLTQPVLGHLEDRLTASETLENSLYPQFVAYNEMFVKDIFENIDMQGLFVQRGARLVFGQKERPATIKVLKNEDVLGRFESESFIVRSNRITSSLATWAVYLEQDSLFHRNSEFRYDDTKKEIAISHSSLFNVQLPFQNTYHKVNIQAEMMFWNIAKDYIEFGLLKIPGRKGVSYFISEAYFSEAKMHELTGGAERNPLFIIAQAANKYGRRKLSFSELANYFKWDVVSMRNLLLNLAVDGFVVYDLNSESVTVQNKLFTYQKISGGKSDFDILKIKSETEDFANATLHLANLDLEINGVDFVLLSEKQNVYIKPDSSKIKLKKDRDILFDGLIHAGRFNFVSKQSKFSYKDFKVDITYIDSLLFAVKSEEVNPHGDVPDIQIKAQLESFSGALYIDDTSNKGGVQDYPLYPIFASTTPSYVYYDQSFIQSGVYLRDSFYFKVSPFVIRRLNTFNTDSIRFAGVFMSGGIFPPLQETLVVMPDYSLGFMTVSSKEGWEVYRGKGRFYDTIILNLEGLQGKGQLDYVGSNSKSSAFLFRPDVLSSSPTFFEHSKVAGNSYPLVTGASVVQTWDPYGNTMFLKTEESPILLYKEDVEFFGTLKVEPLGFSGDGVLILDNGGQIKGESIEFKPRSIYSPLADFTLKTKDKEATYIQSAGYKIDISLDNKLATFESKTKNSLIHFPFHKYMAFVEKLNWEMQENIVRVNEDSIENASFYALNSKQREAMEGRIEFVSVHPRQDSLRFFANKAIFNAKDELLVADQVPYILVADVVVFPDSGHVVVSPDAKIQKLENAFLFVNVEQMNFEFYEAVVEIFSKKNYRASAKYNYPYASQVIYFPSLKPNAKFVSEGEARIASSDNFKLNEAFDFQGKVKLNGESPYLFYEGSTSCLYTCDLASPNTKKGNNRLKLSSFIDPSFVSISVGDMSTTTDLRPISRGFYVNAKGAPVYSFFEVKKPGNLPMLEVSGDLSFQASEYAYQVKLPDQTVQLNCQVQNCVVRATDFVDLYWTVEPVATQLFSTVTYEQKNKAFLFESVFGLDFFMDEKLLESIAEALNLDPDLDVAQKGTERFSAYMETVLSVRDAKKYIYELSTYSSLLKIPEDLRHTFLFSDIGFKWDERNNAYFFQGDAEIASIGKYPVFKSVNSTVLLTKNRRGDVFEMYFELNPRNWYYFNYTNGIMQIISSDIVFNEKLMKIKASRRSQKKYEYTLSSMRKKNEFLNRVKMYFGEEGFEQEEWSEDDTEYIEDDVEYLENDEVENIEDVPENIDEFENTEDEDTGYVEEDNN